jgi:predicted RNase H-like HicB family nuclease
VALRYLVVVEKGPKNYGAYVPDVPGCVAVGKTIEATLKLMKEALTGHLELLQEDGDPFPLPVTHEVSFLDATEIAGYVEVEVEAKVV